MIGLSERRLFVSWKLIVAAKCQVEVVYYCLARLWLDALHGQSAMSEQHCSIHSEGRKIDRKRVGPRREPLRRRGVHGNTGAHLRSAELVGGGQNVIGVGDWLYRNTTTADRTDAANAEVFRLAHGRAECGALTSSHPRRARGEAHDHLERARLWGRTRGPAAAAPAKLKDKQRDQDGRSVRLHRSFPSTVSRRMNLVLPA